MEVLRQLFCMCLFGVMLQLASAKVDVKVGCNEDLMEIEVLKSDDVVDLYLEHLRDFPVNACKAEVSGNKAVFRLSLNDIDQCGLTRVVNMYTGRTTYYHRVVGDYGPNKEKDITLAKCHLGGRSDNGIQRPVVLPNVTEFRSKRDVLPAGFEEPEILELDGTEIGKAPEPILNVGVRQGGQLIGDELSVKPGTPLQMEIYLDKISADTFGLLVSTLVVSDTHKQEEAIIINGCSVDPYLFENFNTIDGDFLTAKFRAFKFPESTYVLFKGTINICLDKCRGIDCSNGQIGFGKRRKKRRISQLPPDPNRIFEVSINTIMKIEIGSKELIDHGVLGNSLSNATEEIEETIIQRETLKFNPLEGEVRRLDTPDLFNSILRNQLRSQDKTNSAQAKAQSVLVILFALLAVFLRNRS